MATETEQQRQERVRDSHLDEAEELLVEAVRRVRALRDGDGWSALDDSPSSGARIPYLMVRTTTALYLAREANNLAAAPAPTTS